MAIPKTIFQTFKTNRLPFITRFHINSFRRKNKDYEYEFYDDERIEKFFEQEFDSSTIKAYKRLNIGAAKADMFRYAILYKKGGIYVDIDSKINTSLNKLIRPDDSAILTLERHYDLFSQWALIYDAGHPFLKRTLELIEDNISQNKFPNNVHGMTGPTVYTEAVHQCLKEDPSIPHRVFGRDYEGFLSFKYKFGKFFLYEKRSEHWKQKQLTVPVLKPESDL